MNIDFIYKLIKFYKKTIFEDREIEMFIENIIENNLKIGE